MQTPLICVGSDISKARPDVNVRPSGKSTSVSYDAGITKLLGQLTKVPPTRIVVEATGGLDRPLRRALVEAAFPVLVLSTLARSGKGAKVTPVTAIRKLLTTVNATVHHGTPWHPVVAANA